MRLFADDTIVYITIKSHASAQSLQEDLHNLKLWEKEWSMEFNPDKCEVLIEYTEKRNQLSSHTHFMTPPSEPQKTQNISGSLSVVTSIWSYINTITNKAKNSLRFIRRNVKTQNKQLKEAAYRTYVRPRSNIVQPYGTHGRNTSHTE